MNLSTSTLEKDLPAVGTGDYFINLSNNEEVLSFIEEQSESERYRRNPRTG